MTSELAIQRLLLLAHGQVSKATTPLRDALRHDCCVSSTLSMQALTSRLAGSLAHVVLSDGRYLCGSVSVHRTAWR